MWDLGCIKHLRWRFLRNILLSTYIYFSQNSPFRCFTWFWIHLWKCQYSLFIYIAKLALKKNNFYAELSKLTIAVNFLYFHWSLSELMGKREHSRCQKSLFAKKLLLNYILKLIKLHATKFDVVRNRTVCNF